MRVLAYSAIRNEAFALVREEADRPTRLRRWSAARGVWTWQTTRGTVLGTPLSLVLHLEEGALYALDQPDDAPAVTRLVRIDLVTGAVTVVAPGLLKGSYGARSISIAHRGGLLLAATRPGEEDLVQLAHLEIDGTGVRVLDRFERASSLRGTARENASGVYYLRKTQSGVAPERVPFDAFTPATSSEADPVFP